MPAIVTQGLTRRFAQRTAVYGGSMTVPQEAVYGFLGPNRAGKATTPKMLPGHLKPGAGQDVDATTAALTRDLIAAVVHLSRREVL